MYIKKLVDDVEGGVIALRRAFHGDPELSGREVRTCQKICDCLQSHQIPFQANVGGHGVVAMVQGKPGRKTIAIRGDIDALPIQEETDVPFRSKNDGIMHACGHDAHTAMLLGAAIVLSQYRNQFHGCVKFFFQPAEEAGGGALPMIEAGCMENPTVDHTIGLHVMPTVPVGSVELRHGMLNGNTGSLTIVVHGSAGHAAYPETATDAVVIAAHIVTALQTLVSRNTSPLNSVVLTIGTIHGGEKNNIIAHRVQMGGTLRAIDDQSRHRAKEQIRRIVTHTAEANGGFAEVEFQDGYIALLNDEQTLSTVEQVAIDLVGKDRIIYKQHPSMGGEDFSYFAKEVPSAFVHLGCRNEKTLCDKPLHNNCFKLDEDCLKLGVELEVRSALRLLENELNMK